MNRFKNILYVFQPSATQNTAIARAVALAQNNQADLTIMEVIPWTPAGIGLPPGGPISADLQAEMVNQRRDALASLVAPYIQQLDIRLEILTGPVFLEVIRAVLRERYDLVIRSAEDPNWISRLFGSEDMHLLRKCPCPVWLMKPAEKSNYDSILAAVDFDPSHPETISKGINAEILALSGSLALSDFAELHVIHTWDAPAEGLVRTWANDPQTDSTHYIETERRRHQESMERLRNHLRDQIGQEAFDYLAPNFHVSRGSAQILIPEAARQLNADLMVMGTIARTGIPGFIIGNTAEAILDQLKCSVLAIKPPGFKSPVRLEA